MAKTIADLFVGIGADITDFKKAMADMKSTLKDVGQDLKDTGESLSQSLTAPLAGLGLGALVAANDVQKGAGQIEASLGLTKDEAQGLNDAANELWRDAFGDSVHDAAQAVAEVTKNMQGLGQTDGQIKGLTEQAFILRDVFGAEINESSRTAAVMMRNFGIEGSNAMDLITTGFQKGGDFSGELLDTMREYSPAFATMGHDAEDMLGILIAGAQAGAWNLDKVGDAVKEFNIRAKDGSDTTAEGFEAIGLNAAEMGAAIAEGGDKGQQAFAATIASLAGMENEVERNAAGVALFGTQWEDLEADVIKAMAGGVDSIKDVEGATKDAGDAIYDNIGTQATEVWRDFVAALQPVGAVLIGLAQKVLPPVGEALGEIAGWFEALSPGIQIAIVIVGALVAAIGPLLIFAGMIANAIAALIPLFTAVGAAIMGAAVPIWPIIAAIAALIAIGVLLYQNWEQVKAFAIETWSAILAYLQPVIDTIRAYILDKFEEVKNWWLETWPELKEAFVNIWNFILAFITPIIDAIVAIFKWAWPYLEWLIMQVWQNIKGIIDGALKIVMNIISAFANLFTGDWAGLWENIKGIISGALQLIWNWVQLFGIGRLLKFFGSLGGKLIGKVKDMWNKIKYEFNFKMLQITDTVKGKFNGIVDFITGLKTTFFNAGKGLIENMIKGITNMAKKVVDKVKNIAKSIRDLLPFSPAKEGPLSDLDKLDFGGPIGDSITRALPDVQRMMSGLVTMPDVEGGNASYITGSNQTVIVELDGRQIARGTLPHMEREIRLKTGIRF